MSYSLNHRVNCKVLASQSLILFKAILSALVIYYPSSPVLAITSEPNLELPGKEQRIKKQQTELSQETKVLLELVKSPIELQRSKKSKFSGADSEIFLTIPEKDSFSTQASDLQVDNSKVFFTPVERLTQLTEPTEPVEAQDAQVPSESSETATAGASDLAQQAQNPIANLISLPLQNNFNFGVGPFKEMQYLLNFQPVIPTPLSEDWLLVNRIITPILVQPTVDIDTTTGTLEKGGSEFGLGDINPSFFFVPRTDSNVTWGVGPVFLLPTATDKVLGTERWGIGPTAVVVITSGKWLVGTLANQIWSFAGNEERSEVSQFLVQPFINYSLTNTWTVSFAPTITANWNAVDRDDVWTVPLGLTVSKLVQLGGKQPATFAFGGFYNVARPEFSPEWSLRFQFTLLYPVGQ